MQVANFTPVSEVAQRNGADTVTDQTSIHGNFRGKDVTLKMRSQEDLPGAVKAHLKGQIAKPPHLPSQAMSNKLFQGAKGRTDGNLPTSFQNIRQHQESFDSMPANR